VPEYAGYFRAFCRVGSSADLDSQPESERRSSRARPSETSSGSWKKANSPETDAKIALSTRFHDLRHSSASLLLAQGVQLRAIMELLGQSTIALTANTYSHVMPSMMQDMADKMDAIFNG
jgi:site-specific recombinase XerD